MFVVHKRSSVPALRSLCIVTDVIKNMSIKGNTATMTVEMVLNSWVPAGVEEYM